MSPTRSIVVSSCRVLLGTAFLLPVIGVSHPVFARGPELKMTPAVRRMIHESKAMPFIVQLREPVKAGDFEALKRAGAHITRKYDRLPMVAITAAGTRLPGLAALGGVCRISPDQPVKATSSTVASGQPVSCGDPSVLIHGD